MASPSGPRSGKHGYVDGFNYIRNWSLTKNQALESRIHSASRGAPVRYAGVEDWNGTIEGFGGKPGIFPGDKVALTLFEGADDGVLGHTGMTWEGNAIIDSLTINWSWQPNQTLNWAATFSANGCLSQTEYDIYDPGTECAAQACSLAIQYQQACEVGTGSGGVGEGEGAVVLWNNVESATLSINASNQAYVNSSTSCCTYRESGNIDWTLSVVDQEQYPILIFDTYYRLWLYTSFSEFWSLNFGMLQDVSNIRVDIESGAIINKTNTLAMSAWACCGEERTEGEIISPSDALEWPVALA